PISRTRAETAPELPMRWVDPGGTHTLSPDRATHESPSTVTSSGPSRTCQNSPRYSWVCNDRRCPGSTVTILTVVGSLSVNCSKRPQGRCETKIDPRGSGRWVTDSPPGMDTYPRHCAAD